MFSSNGDGFVFHDRTGTGDAIETESRPRCLPVARRSVGALSRLEGPDAGSRADRPAGLLTTTAAARRRATIRSTPINAAIEAIAKGRDRILLVMATGTGKTYTAFQIIWRLWKAGRKKRILFLADRNVLIDQTMVNDFRPFGAAMAKLSTDVQDHRARRRHAAST